jgi:hypothetical protein
MKSLMLELGPKKAKINFSPEFYKEGKYDLDFKNKNSDPSKWVSC